MKVRICLKEFPVQGKRYLKMFFVYLQFLV